MTETVAIEGIRIDSYLVDRRAIDAYQRLLRRVVAKPARSQIGAISRAAVAADLVDAIDESLDPQHIHFETTDPDSHMPESVHDARPSPGTHMVVQLFSTPPAYVFIRRALTAEGDPLYHVSALWTKPELRKWQRKNEQRKKKMSTDRKELDELITRARKQGWEVDTERKRGHIGFFPADSSHGPIFTGTTPGDWRAMKNLRSQLRRAGLVMPGEESNGNEVQQQDGPTQRCPHDGSICQKGCTSIGACTRLSIGEANPDPYTGFPLDGFVEAYNHLTGRDTIPETAPEATVDEVRGAAEWGIEPETEARAKRREVPEAPPTPKARVQELDPTDLFSSADALLEMRKTTIAQFNEYLEALMRRRNEIDQLIDTTRQKLDQLNGKS